MRLASAETIHFRQSVENPLEYYVHPVGASSGEEDLEQRPLLSFVVKEWKRKGLRGWYMAARCFTHA